jgi:hypothetical protein
MFNPLKVYTSFYSLMLLYAMMMPTFHSFMGSYGTAIVNGGLIISIVTFFLIKNGARNYIGELPLNSYFGLYILLLFLFFALIPVSMLSGVIFGGVSIINRDFFEFQRPLFNLLVFIFAFYSFQAMRSIEELEKLLLVVFFCVVFIGLNQFLGVFDSFSGLYTKALNISTRRVSAPFVNPYDYAFFMSFYVIYFLLKALLVGPRYLSLFFIALVFLILPQSRAVAGGAGIAIVILLPLILIGLGLNFNKFTIHKSVSYLGLILVALLVIFVLAFPYLLDSFPYLTGQFVRLVESGEIGKSGQLRLDQFYFALAKAENNPFLLLVGNGPAKNEMEYVESIYNYYFYRYGILGMVIYFTTLILSAFLCLKILKEITLNSRYAPLFLAVFVWLISIPILSIGNNFTEQVRTSFFFYSILGLIAASYYTFSRRVDV